MKETKAKFSNVTLTLSGLSNIEKEHLIDFVKDNEWKVEIS
jgi:hypothetical protein